MNNEAIKAAYRRYAAVYDTIFGSIFQPGRRLIVESLGCRPGDRVLEVGVGTGLSLPLYPRSIRLTAIDISREMLARARMRVEREGLTHVDAVLEMDAESMDFPDHSFDRVVAMYVVSVVPNPSRLVEEMRRVCKPDGDIYIVNHFRSKNPIIGASERLFSPFSKVAGFRPDLDFDAFVHNTRLDVVKVRRANLFGYWKFLHCRNGVDAAMVA